MKASELRERKSGELQRLQEENQDSLFQARIKNATHQLTDTSSLRKSRKELARIKTVLSERSRDKAREADGK